MLLGDDHCDASTADSRLPICPFHKLADATQLLALYFPPDSRPEPVIHRTFVPGPLSACDPPDLHADLISNSSTCSPRR